MAHRLQTEWSLASFNHMYQDLRVVGQDIKRIKGIALLDLLAVVLHPEVRSD
jgi:hypothetical protein